MIGNDPVECTSGQNGCCATAFSPQVAVKAGWVKCKTLKAGTRWRCNDCNYAITLGMPAITLHGSARLTIPAVAETLNRGAK